MKARNKRVKTVYKQHKLTMNKTGIRKSMHTGANGLEQWSVKGVRTSIGS